SIKKRYVHKNGSAVWANVTASLVRADSGEPKYFIGVIEDINERRKIEAARRASEMRLSLALEAAHMGTWERNLQTGKGVWSEKQRDLFGLGEGPLEVRYDQFLQ